jgi:hypothetical protein
MTDALTIMPVAVVLVIYALMFWLWWRMLR